MTALRSARAPAMGFIFVTLLIDIMGAGLVIPVLPQLVARLAGGTQIGAKYFGIFLAVYALAQFICAPLLGALSDRLGRRPVLLVSLLGIGLDYLLQFFAPTLGWLFLGRVIAGVTGANITAANAYIADVSPPEQRARNFGLVGAAFGVGFIIGPAIGGVLGGIDVRLPFAFAAGLAFLNFLYGLFVLPESLPKEKRNFAPLHTVNPLSSLSNLGKYPVVRGLTFSFVLINLAQQGLFSTWVLFTNYALNWNATQNGWGLAAVGLSSAVVQAGLTGYAVKKLGEKRAIVIGLLIGALEFLGFGLVHASWQMYLVIVLGSLGGIGGPAIQALISKAVSEREQGTVQGALASLGSLVGIAGPPLATWLFATFTGTNAPVVIPGIAFFVGSGLMLVAVLASVGVLRAYRPPVGAGAD